MDRFHETNRFKLSDLILRSPAERSEAGRLEGWQLARPSPLAILRDTSLRDAPQDEVGRGCQCDTNFGNAVLDPEADRPGLQVTRQNSMRMFHAASLQAVLPDQEQDQP